MWKILYSSWTVVLQVECRVLEWTLCGRYCTAGGHWYCRLNGVYYFEHYVEDTAQQVDSGIAGWMEWFTVNIKWKVLKSMWTVVLQVWMECVIVNIMWNVLHSSWTVISQVEWSVLQWTLCGRYCTAGGQWYCGWNGVCYSDNYVEGTAKQVDSDISGRMECVTANIMWKLLLIRWTVVLQVE